MTEPVTVVQCKDGEVELLEARGSAITSYSVILSSSMVAEENLCFVNAEMTLAGLVPHLARFRPMAANSLAAVRAEVTALATGATRLLSRTTS